MTTEATIEGPDDHQPEDNANNIPEPVQLGYIDIQNLLKIVDYAHTKGAYSDWEVLEQVLPVRQRTKAFLDYVEAMQASSTQVS